MPMSSLYSFAGKGGHGMVVVMAAPGKPACLVTCEHQTTWHGWDTATRRRAPWQGEACMMCETHDTDTLSRIFSWFCALARGSVRHV